MESRNGFVDVLRGVGVLYIVGFWHLMNYTNAFPAYANSITYRVTVVVLGLFTFLSGYFIGRSKVIYEKNGSGRFYIKRFVRIYPLYFLALVVFRGFHLIDNSTLLRASLGISMFYGSAPPTLWFVAMVMVFYCVAPVLMIVVRRFWLFVIVSTGIFVFLMLLYLISPSADPRLMVYYPAFVMGIYWATQDFPVGMGRLFMIGTIGLLSVVLSFSVAGSPEQSLASAPLACVIPLIIFIIFSAYARRVVSSQGYATRNG